MYMMSDDFCSFQDGYFFTSLNGNNFII